MAFELDPWTLATPLLVFALAGSAGCAGDDDTSDSDDDGHQHDSALSCDGTQDAYYAGIEKVGAAGISVKITDSKPAPPAALDNVWTVELHDASQAAVDGAIIRVAPWMPAHKHGTPPPSVLPQGSGVYQLSPVFFSMTGIWQVTFEVTTAAGAKDTVEFDFCIKG